MRKLITGILLFISVGCFGQIIPGVVASSILISVPFGNEMITNGGFANGTGWDGNGVTFTGGEAVVNKPAAYSTTLSTLAGGLGILLNHTYRLEFDITSYSSGGIKVGLGDTSNGVYCANPLVANGHYSFDLTQTDAVAPDNIIVFTFAAGAVLHIDNISLKEKF